MKQRTRHHIRLLGISSSTAILLTCGNLAMASGLELKPLPIASSDLTNTPADDPGQEFGWRTLSEAISPEGRNVLRRSPLWHGLRLYQSESVMVRNERNELISESGNDLRPELLRALAGKNGEALGKPPALSETAAIRAAEQASGQRMQQAELLIYPVMKTVRRPAAMLKTEAELDALDLLRTLDHLELAWQVTPVDANGSVWLISASDGKVLQQGSDGEAGGVRSAIRDILPWAQVALAAGKLMAPEQAERLQALASAAHPQAQGHLQWSAALARLPDVQERSNPARQMFYLLQHGTEGKGSGIGLEKAWRILARAMAEKFDDSTGYAQARDHMLAAARELYGPHSMEEEAVNQAFAAIRVGAAAAPFAPGCTSISISPSWPNNLFPWSGGKVTATANCVDAQTYAWTISGTDYPGNTRTNYATLGQNTSGVVQKADVCVIPISAGGVRGIPFCTIVQADYLRKPVCAIPAATPNPVPATGGNVTVQSSCTTSSGAPLSWLWYWDTDTNAGNASSLTRNFPLNSTTSVVNKQACITATNAAGSSAPVCKLVTQAANNVPTCSNIGFNPGQVPRTGGPVIGTATCSGNLITRYLWNINGKDASEYGNGPVISATFPQNTGPASSIRVCVTAFNAVGPSPIICRDLKVL